MMTPFFDSETGLEFPSALLEPNYRPSSATLERALEGMILSASGWRKVFATGGEDSAAAEVGQGDQVLAALMGLSFYQFLVSESGTLQPRVCVGLDSRPTGPVLADCLLRVLISLGAECEYLGIVAAPEIMGYVGTSGHHGFVYVSASHNPIGHNGVKFGLSDGGVLGGAQAAALIATYRNNVARPEAVSDVLFHLKSNPTPKMGNLLHGIPRARVASRHTYSRLTDTIFTLTEEPELREVRKEQITKLILRAPVGIVAEFNGSARCVSIDRSWLEGLGVAVEAINDKPGQIVHRIVPEGSSLDLCRDTLEALARRRPEFVLGYVPDCDGDRGNVVWYDSRADEAKILEAQQVFSLCVVSELAGLDYFGEAGTKVAVVCNDPTSLRIDEIAAAFGAKVFRAEVGEANVVALARQLRAQGWTVRILGEGSNGGNITYPSAVRDPLSTLGSLLKLLRLRSVEGTPGLFERWCTASGQREAYRSEASMAEILSTLPVWTTTSAYENRAVLKITSTDHARFKASWEREFQTDWPLWQPRLGALLGVTSWSEVNYEGLEERPGVGPSVRGGRQTGGLKILLKGEDSVTQACLWMRGSGTEPVFRVLVDVKGHKPETEAILLDWLTDLVRRADRG
jgi:phosphomannomutase